MDRQRIKKYLLALVMGAAAACILLCGCGSMDSCVSGCSVLRSIWTPELTVDESRNMPVIEGSLSAEEVTLQLESFYTPIATTVQIANSADGAEKMFELEHELVAVENSYYLHSHISCAAGGQIDLPRIYIPYAGETAIPQWSFPSELGSDAHYTAAWMELTANGVDVSTADSGREMAMTELLEIYIDYYREMSGMQIDISRFAQSVEYDTLLREAMVLGLCDDEYTYGEAVNHTYLLNTSCDLLAAMYNDVCGNGSAGFTEIELLECIRTFLTADILWGTEWDEDARQLIRLIDDRIDKKSQSGLAELSRLEIASVLVEIGELMYGSTDADYENWFAADTDDHNVAKAWYRGYMNDFFLGGYFAPAYAPGHNSLPELVDSFIFQSACNTDIDLWDKTLTYRDVICGLSAVDICVRRAGLSESEYVVVNNSRDYDWYYTQHGTGWYSGVNCMPTITMMATKWYDEDTDVTIREMRERYLPEYTGGWYTWQVAECLTENGVPNQVVDVSEDMIPYLDQGKIILSQMSEAADDESGHCFVIYGYIKRGDTVKFLVHDPDVYDGIDSYGRRPGDSMILDSRYCKWIIDRIAFSYVVVG